MGPPQLSRFQFTLRASLILLLIAGVAFGLIGFRLRQERSRQQALARQQEAIAQFVRFEASVGYDREENGDVISIHFSNENDLSDEDLKNLQALPRLTALSLNLTKITDQGLRHLSRAPALEALDLNAAQFTQIGAGHLKSLDHLKTVNVYGVNHQQRPRIERLKGALPGVEITY